MMPWLKLDPSWLPPGTLIGPWKVKAFHGGGGGFSAVFRAVRAMREHGGWVALKVASSPWDPRFRREVELLSRIRHPGVPRFLGQGQWKHPDGAAYPFVVMEWVEGVPLYEWAAQAHPSAEEPCRVLTQLAWALEATHAAEGVHRDVKGDNIRIVPSGLRAVLMDFGAGNYTGAARLTREGFPPGTDTYRSPEAWEFALHRPRNSTAVYEARPADDVFALGVSAYRMVTGTYPPPMDVHEEETGPGRMVWTAPRPPRELNPRVDPRLSALILRMLSAKPAERPTARELAVTLEEMGSKFRQARERMRAYAPLIRWLATAHVPPWVRHLASVTLGGVLATLMVLWGLQQAQGDKALHKAGGQFRDTGPTGLGDAEAITSAEQVSVPSGWESLGLPMPEKPFPGQRRAPHCRPPLETNIRGGCWIAVLNERPRVER